MTPSGAPGRRSASRSAALAAMTLASAFPLWVGANASRLLGDDAFITLTYARSLASGQGLTYDGNAVLGTTTPLLALVAAVVSRLLPSADLAGVAVWIGAASWLATGWLVFLGRRPLRLELWTATALGLMALLGGWPQALGMEVHLFLMLLVAATVLAFACRSVAAGLACGLLALTRGEGLLLVPILALGVWVAAREDALSSPDRRRSGLRSVALLALGCLTVIVPWSLYAVAAYGSPVPNTLAVKLAQTASGLWQPFAADLGSRWLPVWASSWGPSSPALANLIWWLVGMGLAWSLVRDRTLLVLVAWSAAYVAAYAALGVPSYPWYGLPAFFVLQLIAALGGARVRDLPPKRVRVPWLRNALAGLAVAFLLAGALVPRVDAVRTDRGDARASSYLNLASWLDANAAAADSVAYIEIGYLGYFGSLRIVDLAGLVTPDVVPHVEQGDFASGFFAHSPDWFVYLPDFDWALEDILADPRFETRYAEAVRLPGPNAADFTVYRRVEQ